MKGVEKLALVLATAASSAAILVACGGSGDATQSTAASTAGSASRSGEGSAGFRTPGGDNSIQDYGAEAGTATLAAASAALAAYLRARSRAEWAKSCAYLATAAVKPLQQLASSSPRLKGKGCAAILAGLSAGTPASIRADTLSGGVASLRVKGARGFALYRDSSDTAYFVPMVEEGGSWKIGATAPSEFP